jgi:hypothetical protein
MHCAPLWFSCCQCVFMVLGCSRGGMRQRTVHVLQRGALLKHDVPGQHLNAFPPHPHAIALSTRWEGRLLMGENSLTCCST